MVLVGKSMLKGINQKRVETELRVYFQIDLASRIKSARKVHGLSQAQVAALLHLSQSAISKYESGQVLPDLLVLLSFCHLYKRELEKSFDCPFFREYQAKLPCIED
ncbi:helix-turn-helix transcriptional regulator [Fructobacillus sp. M2-14]|uniref:Helix-turn-helix transcriptional regulator n=1 Tax=Fructobacillus broussonetiae TaxID=2713173 RepID=A0ABS5R1N7_9LACO|nr:helix-turn-helix transcriptional regulator [Fructobacillus broussonetiae]MBS9339157.1 helix-turn-helix transcriptional regulator [Fructobacillus broussonetiae]